jgi:predicted short-subunit dehydrogenase-like oxidoreductase (DUF2520 family)
MPFTKVFIKDVINLKFGFIGAGKVGKSFGIYLKNNGFNIAGYYSKSIESAKKGAKLTDSKAYDDMRQLIDNVDIIFITTNDDEIKNIVDILYLNSFINNKIVVHTSGSYSSNILSPLKELSCFVYSIHPLQSFADIDNSVKSLKNSVFTIEGCLEKIHVIESILNKTNNNYFKINSDDKPIYHAGACVISNYLVTLMDYGISLFESIGIKEKEALDALYPLIDGTIQNVRNLGCSKAITGPISRGDYKTIQTHLNAMENSIPSKVDFYKNMALMTLLLSSKEKLLDEQKIQNIKNILD